MIKCNIITILDNNNVISYILYFKNIHMIKHNIIIILDNNIMFIMLYEYNMLLNDSAFAMMLAPTQRLKSVEQCGCTMECYL